ncbi:unnamed protein product [Mytilus coruscus]|uniref:Uncharacterized protein n=1 Tax=Mytilus coruscus TaxID=42192 RepID=A0A6J8D915_MYTCO|nr:unnamed protein product [Mytilus coruscus]
MVDTPTIPLVEKCEVPQGNLVAPALLTGDQEGPVANVMRELIGAVLPIENSSSLTRLLPQQRQLWHVMRRSKKVGTPPQTLQRPPVNSGTTALRVTIASVRCGPNRRQWDPGIPYLYTGINTVQVKKNETKLFTTENGSAQPPGSNKIEDLQPLSVQGLVCIKTGKSWHTIQRRTIHSCLGSQFVENPLY